MNQFHFAASLLSLGLIVADYCLAGLLYGFFASVSVLALFALVGCLIWTQAGKTPFQRLQRIKFGTRYFFVEVA